MTNQNQFSRGVDKRYIPRWSVQNKILYRKEKNSTYQEAYSKDINSSGACFSCPEEIKPSAKLTLVLYLADAVAVEVTGRVLWNKDAQPHNLVGVRFENTSEQVQEMILQYAFECKKEALTRHWFEGWENKESASK